MPAAARRGWMALPGGAGLEGNGDGVDECVGRGREHGRGGGGLGARMGKGGSVIGGGGSGRRGRGIARTGTRSDLKKIVPKNYLTFIYFYCRRYDLVNIIATYIGY